MNLNRMRWIGLTVLWMSCEEGMSFSDCDNDLLDGGCESYDSEADEYDIQESVHAITGSQGLNNVYYVTGDTPLYSTATGSTVLRTIADKATVKMVVANPSNGRYRIEHASSVWGWIPGSALTLAYRFNANLSSRRTAALARARMAMGFSYWWGHGRWNGTSTGGATPSNRGACSGDCPNCTHRADGAAEYGSDCIHFVDTVWGAGTDTDPNTDGNGCSIRQFRSATGSGCVPGTVISNLANVRAADAVVISGHIFLVAENYSAAGGQISTYECVGCSDKCRRMRRNLFSLDSPVAVTRTGW